MAEEQQQSDPFEEYRVLDVSKTAELADLVAFDVNGTEVILKARKHFPMLVEIYVEDEPEPIGAINIAKGCTVSLGGVDEGLRDRLMDTVESLREGADDLEKLAHRTNPTGMPNPKESDSDDE